MELPCREALRVRGYVAPAAAAAAITTDSIASVGAMKWYLI